MKKILTIIISFSVMSNIIAQKLQTKEDSVAYALGANTATQFISELQNLGLSEKTFLTGFSAAINKDKILFSENEIRTMLQKYFTEKSQAEEQKAKDACMEQELKNQDFFLKNKENKDVVCLENGLQYKVITKGTGTRMPVDTDAVTLHYHGTLLDGTVFDSSVERGEPITFPVNGVIPGFSQVIKLMTTGAKYIAYIPSDLAYGTRGAGIIKPCSALIFEIELISIAGDEQAEGTDTKTAKKAKKKSK